MAVSPVTGFGAAEDAPLRDDPFRGFNFRVEIEGIVAGGFAECTGLHVEIETTDYREGGRNDFVHRFAGAAKYPPLILKRGLTRADALWAWHQDVLEQRVVRRSGTIYLLDRRKANVMWWHFKDAFPVKWSGPDLHASSGTVAFESVELAHRGLQRGVVAAAGPDPSFGTIF